MSLPMPPTPAPTLPHCYRHPDRETGRSCTRCGKPACSDCLIPASVGSHCLDCTKAARPDVKTRARYWNAKQNILVTYVIMGLNLAVFAYTTLTNTRTLTGRNGISEQQADLALYKPVLQYSADFEWYRLVSSGFLHFGIIHIALNMLMLYQLGQLIEPAIGRTRYVLLYAASLLGGSLGVLILDENAVVGGASGAVFGLLAASAIGLHRRGINVFSTGIGTTLVLNLVLTFSIRNISVGGHLGGAAAGAICGFVMLAPKWRPMPTWATWAAPVAVAVIAVIGSIVVVG
jgi:membrane associated rhomboid family serine protease